MLDDGEEIFTTWQIGERGLRRLRAFGLDDNGYVSYSDFFDLREAGLIWTNGTGGTTMPRPVAIKTRDSTAINQQPNSAPIQPATIVSADPHPVRFKLKLETRRRPWSILASVDWQRSNQLEVRWIEWLANHYHPVLVYGPCEVTIPRDAPLQPLQSINLKRGLDDGDLPVMIRYTNNAGKHVECLLGLIRGLRAIGTVVRSSGDLQWEDEPLERNRYYQLVVRNQESRALRGVRLPGQSQPYVGRTWIGWWLNWFQLGYKPELETERVIYQLEYRLP